MGELLANQLFFFYQRGCSGKFVHTSTNHTGSEVNDYVSL
jgi:hypothetical protein